MATTIGRYSIQRPNSGSSAQLPYGLFAAANGPLPLPDKASLGGLDYQTPYCKQAQGYDVACTPGSKAASLVGGPTTVVADPFVVLAGMECGALSGDEERDPDEYSAWLVTEALRAQEQRLVEAIFSRELNGQQPGLSNSGATQLAASTNIINAFGLLEATFGAVYGLPAVIHVPLIAASMVKREGLVDKVDKLWKTVLGNVVSFGNYAGYSALDVAPAANRTNIYITGQVNIWRNDIFVSPWEASIDKNTNQVHRFAERTYIVAYECTAMATDVDYTACC